MSAARSTIQHSTRKHCTCFVHIDNIFFSNSGRRDRAARLGKETEEGELEQLQVSKQ